MENLDFRRDFSNKAIFSTIGPKNENMVKNHVFFQKVAQNTQEPPKSGFDRYSIVFRCFLQRFDFWVPGVFGANGRIRQIWGGIN